MLIFTSLLAGIVFGLGLIVSGMANPAKVLGFLDVAGAWDPSLMLVMAGAVGVAFFALRVARRRPRSLLGAEMRLPGAQRVDARLAAGAALFGVGWGMAGLCPGPALLGVGMGQPRVLLFVLAMLAGMLLVDVIENRRKRVAARKA